MNNFGLINNKINRFLILKEMQKAINSGRIPQDLGAANRSNTMKEVIVSFDGRYADSHPSTGWINLVSSFWLPDPIFRKVCSKDSKFLYKTPLYKHFPNTIKYLKQFAKENNCELQRVIFASLLPEGKVLPHVDYGEYPKHRDRYHIVLNSPLGSEMHSGEETQVFKNGELWWIQNKEIHWVNNLNNTPRLHIIFDLLPKNHFSFREKIFNTTFNYFFQKYYDNSGKEDFSELLIKFPIFKRILLSK